jgi:hypothetical protein
MALSEDQFEDKMKMRAMDFIYEAALLGKELGAKIAYAKAVNEWNRENRKVADGVRKTR